MYEEHDEYERARRLLAPLSDEPIGPSRVDLRRAMSDGRRRLRTRQLAGVGGLAAMTALAVAGIPTALVSAWEPDAPTATVALTPGPTTGPSPSGFPVPTASPDPAPVPPTGCELVLPSLPPEVQSSYASGADPTGEIIFGRYFPVTDDPASTYVQPVLWIDGQPTLVPAPGADASIQAVNSSGVAVGHSMVGESEEDIGLVAWIYRDGEVTELAGENASPDVITEDGIVLGTRADGGVPVVWRTPDGPPEDLPIPGFRGEFHMNELRADGTAVGSRLSDGRGRAFVWWPDGSVQDIPLPKVDGEWGGFRPQALNGHLIVGEVTLGQSGDLVYVSAAYDLMAGEYTLLSEDAPIEVWASNRHGWVVGEADGHAGLWTPEGGLVPLPDLGVHNEYAPNLPLWVSDDGRTVVGTVDARTGEDRAAVWRCA